MRLFDPALGCGKGCKSPREDKSLATGIGYAAALQLAKLGAKVVICSRTVDELEAAAARIEAESGSPYLAVPTDVLVNNAGGTRMGPLESVPTKGWDSIFDLNVKIANCGMSEARVREQFGDYVQRFDLVEKRP